jgi:hypothetical protein
VSFSNTALYSKSKKKKKKIKKWGERERKMERGWRKEGILAPLNWMSSSPVSAMNTSPELRLLCERGTSVTRTNFFPFTWSSLVLYVLRVKEKWEGEKEKGKIKRNKEKDVVCYAQ